MPDQPTDRTDEREQHRRAMWGDESYIFECRADDCTFTSHGRTLPAAVDNAHVHAERTGHTVDVWIARIQGKAAVDPHGADYYDVDGWADAEPLGYAGGECPECGAEGDALQWSSAEVGDPKQVLCNECGAVVCDDTDAEGGHA